MVIPEEKNRPQEEGRALGDYVRKKGETSVQDPSTRTKTVVSYSIDFKFTDGKVRIALREDEHGLKILGMRSCLKRKGLGRKALQLLKEKGIVGRPVNVMHKAARIWIR